jgi:hypothetical protein
MSAMEQNKQNPDQTFVQYPQNYIIVSKLPFLTKHGRNEVSEQGYGLRFTMKLSSILTDGDI